jgi:hypothetical protein
MQRAVARDGREEIYRRGLCAAVMAAAILALAAPVLACGSTPDSTIQLCVDYYTEEYIRLPQHDRTLFNAQTESFFTRHNDGIMSQRNELRVRFDWTPQKINERTGVPVTFHLELRPWYDSAYDLTGWGQGMYRSFLTDDWQTNANGRMDDNYDPLVREYYADIRPKNFFFRLGRQIIPWGKSDGVYMLDVLNNFNYRNPTSFDEQTMKIPVWAANLNWMPTATSDLQVVVEPQFLPAFYPGLPLRGGLPYQGGYQDWTFNVVSFFNQVENGEFGFKIPGFMNKPSARINNWVAGTRWSDQAWGMHYTLNYLYTYTPLMIQFPNTGNFATATAFTEKPTRIHIAGGSVDYEFQSGNKWIDGTVLRGETAFTIDDQYYEGVIGNPENVDHWGLLLGLDRYLGSEVMSRPIYFSMQYWHDLVFNSIHCNTCGADPGGFQGIGFYGSAAGNRGAYYSLQTLFLDKTWGEGDYLDTQFSAIYEWEFQDLWLRPKVTYQFNDDTTAAIGFNIFAGGSQTPFGQYTNNTDIFFEFTRVLF